MDIYDAALRRLKADTRSPSALVKEIDLPLETLRDIQNGTCKNPRFLTLKKVVKHYFPNIA